ncbi:D-alanyl-D-alanine carboxypeptidase/D-alanyl-D-alanine-endopeptidase [Metabacillus iocasae]|uniref:D-alanyl-D-alanine carboxypeptidase/D-alanyl-D-alanine-endopeptidase (Penicillin-binding protein 4) n=1 Tax=Priestia iocasae TaxID=2291674 RepID=A0ABS2QTF7_9BACI|nr:D-alanyl-D-alanine carboxypeptidase/D-alanyl-D-alanine-endopeptidase [Metabacillus iocasae]MBM7702763.1 D-alanyl-D-alanine carboxypeptidase/D-alanyl-D-alanine-endopeptidase (penicillin-binding protein 4) [Metabacillus iocasae]
MNPLHATRNKLLACILLFTLALTPFHTTETPTIVTASNDYTDLEQNIHHLLSDERLNGAISAVSVRDAQSGEIVLERWGDMRLKTASNMKLLTGAAALHTLGPTYTFKTELLTDGKIVGKVLKGNLYLKGKGDPTLLKEDFDEIATYLKSKGIKTIQGNIIADDTWYNAVRLSEDMIWNDESYYYGAQISALTASPDSDYDAGTVIVETSPTKPGKEAEIKLVPETTYPTIINKTKTIESGTRSIRVTREHGTNNIVVEGTIPVDSSTTRSWVTLWEPTGYALDLFKQALEQAGVHVKRQQGEYGETPADATVLYTNESMPLADLLVPFMKLSNNTIAEMLVKEMGKVVHHEGSWEKGLEVLEDYVASRGLNTETMRIRDGSGISHVTNIPANELSKLLVVVQQEEWYPTFLRSLPVAGASERLEGGTLRNRMKGTAAQGNVKAKTGTITGATSLSGYVTTKDGQDLVFSIILNNFMASHLRDIEDKIAVALAEYEKKQ